MLCNYLQAGGGFYAYQIAITKELAARKIVAPSVYKHRQGDSRFSGYGPVTDGDPYRWSSATIGSILRNPVYTGDQILLKTEVVNHKTRQSAPCRMIGVW